MLSRDKSVKELIDIIEKGNLAYKIVTTHSKETIDCTFKAGSNGRFVLALKPETQNLRNLLDLDYFFEKPFFIQSTGLSFFIFNYNVTDGKRSFNDEYEITIKGFRGDNDESLWKNSRQAAYIKFDESKFSPWNSGLQFDLTTDSENKNSYNAVALTVDNTELRFYYERFGDTEGYFVISPKNHIDFEKFNSIAISIITAFGFISGYYMKNSIYFFSHKRIGNEVKMSCIYENEQKLIHTSSPIVDGRRYADIKSEEMRLSSQHFSNLVNLLFHNKEYLRSAQLLIESGLLSECPKAALGAVALETIANKVETEKQSVVVTEKTVINSLKNKLKSVIKEFCDINEEQKNILSNKIDNINSKPNSKKLLEAFSHLGISLSKEEADCINSRNVFLHGNLPKNSSESWVRDDELLNIMANRIIMLSSMLLLKMAGYDGYVIDKGMTEVIKWRMIMNGQKVQSGNCLRKIGKE